MGVLVLVHLAFQRASVFHLPYAEVFQSVVVAIALQFEPSGRDVAWNSHSFRQVLFVIPLVELGFVGFVHFHGDHKHRTSDVL